MNVDVTRLVTCGVCGLVYEEVARQTKNVHHGTCPRCSSGNKQSVGEGADATLVGRYDEGYEGSLIDG